MECFPSCDVHLGPRITANVRPRLDICQHPTVLALSVKSGGKLAKELFVAGNNVEVRQLDRRLELNLRVNFKEIAGVHHASACLEDIRTGNLSCFLNSTLEGDASLCAINRNGQTNSDFIWILFSIIVVTCLLFVGISVFTIMSKFNSSQKSSNSRRPSKLSIEKIAVPRKTSNSLSTPVSGDSNTYLLSPNYYFDERLAVIAEVDEKDQLSEASLSHFESSNSINQRLEQEKQKLSAESANRNKTLAPSAAAQKATIICQKDQVILPQNLNYARRNSQPLIFPTSASLEFPIQIRQQPPSQLTSFAV